MRIKTRTKRRICAVLSSLGFLFALGCVGGIEQNTLPLGLGMVYSFSGIAVLAAAAYKGGFMGTGRRHR